MPELLRVAGLRAGYGEAIVLDGIDLALDEGQSLALLGRNGAGKTTLLPRWSASRAIAPARSSSAAGR